MSRTAIRVVKVGGSLLNLPDLAERLRRWLAAQTTAHHVLVAGGGLLVEQVRKWHAQRPLHEMAAHWMCVDLMTVTAHFLHARLPEIPLIEDDRVLCQRLGEQACTIFGVACWMRQHEPRLPGYCLPANWDVTSDAIAGRVAVVLGADELVLLKSALPKQATACDIAQLTAAGFVDPVLSRLAPELRALRVVDLQASPYEEIVCQDDSL